MRPLLRELCRALTMSRSLLTTAKQQDPGTETCSPERSPENGKPVPVMNRHKNTKRNTRKQNSKPALFTFPGNSQTLNTTATGRREKLMSFSTDAKSDINISWRKHSRTCLKKMKWVSFGPKRSTSFKGGNTGSCPRSRRQRRCRRLRHHPGLLWRRRQCRPFHGRHDQGHEKQGDRSLCRGWDGKLGKR